MVKRFAVDFLGCKVNHYEVEALRAGFLRLGLEEARGPDDADLYVLNTCSVTEHAGATSRKHVRRALRANPRARVLVTGCYAESDREVLAAMAGVTRVFGNAEKEAILGYVARDLLGRPESEALPPLRLESVGDHTRAFVKIEDGCEDHCSFCIIPELRGPAASRDEEEIVSEVTALARHGHREVVLTGVHLGYFGRGRGRRGEALVRLLRRLAEVPGLARLKLSSIEVQELSDELLAVLGSSPVFAPHFHVPLQSGSDRTLARMRRRYTAGLYAERLGALREAVPRPAVSTDVIVGFPGESEEDFEATRALGARLGFMKLHVFPYSPRPGTAAAALPDRLPAAVVERRKQALLALSDALGAAHARALIGTRSTVLVESRRDPATGLLTGLGERYVRTLVDGPDRWRGHAIDVRLGPADDPLMLRGEPLLAGVAR